MKHPIKSYPRSYTKLVTALVMIGTLVGQADLLRNGDFSEHASDSSSLPKSWTLPKEFAGSVACVAADGQPAHFRDSFNIAYHCFACQQF